MRRTKWWLALVAAAALSGCPDNGDRLNLCDNPQLDCDDGDACTADSCDPNTGCINERISCDDHNACTIDRCDSAAGCLHTATPCDDHNACTADSCDAVFGCVSSDVSASCGDGNACTADSCDTALGCVNATIGCDDGNECTTDACDPSSGCHRTPVTDGAACDRGLGRCIAGVCEALGCVRDTDCNDHDACTTDRCNLSIHQCVNTDISSSCDDGNACTEDSCAAASGCVHTDVSSSCDDGDECTIDSCATATGCATAPVADGTSCDGGAGACRSGTCKSLNEVEYQQDFESLDRTNSAALAADGWVVYGNVFDAATDAYLYGYGPFEAPTDGAAFCAISAGQGGPNQGDQQLSVYNDYNNGDHANGRLIESNVYRERTIVAADVGRTISFGFDAKRGNINDPADPLCPCTSKANAFLKTLNPIAGFVTTNLARQNTTALPEDWTRYEISLPIDAALVDQVLQFGFVTTATLYQPSGNFYDNLRVSSAPTIR